MLMLVQCYNKYIWNTEKSSCLDWDSNHRSLDCRSTALPMHSHWWRIHLVNNFPGNYWGIQDKISHWLRTFFAIIGNFKVKYLTCEDWIQSTSFWVVIGEFWILDMDNIGCV
jgi:hypothetical protein